MANPNTPITFTVGDQERLVRIESHLSVIAKLPCLTDTPCPENDRISALEDSRKRGLTGVVMVVVGAVVYAFKLLVDHLTIGG